MTPSILVIEDDQNMLSLIEETLEDEGYIAAGASSGAAAIEMVQRQSYDVVISDIRMPGEVDGLGALEYIKRRHPKTLCIVMTGFADEEAPMRAVRIQVNNYLYKPFGLQEVLQAVKDVLEAGRERSSYEKLFQRLWQTPKNLIESFERVRRESAAKRYEQARDATLQSFFTLIRSRKLSKGAALVCWDRIEPLEDQFLRYDRDPKPFQNDQLSAGAESYLKVRDQMEQMAQANAMGAMKSRETTQVSIPAFHVFYDRILQGKLSFEQVRTAYSLRKLSADDRSRNQELDGLHGKLWEREREQQLA